MKAHETIEKYNRKEREELRVEEAVKSFKGDLVPLRGHLRTIIESLNALDMPFVLCISTDEDTHAYSVFNKESKVEEVMKAENKDAAALALANESLQTAFSLIASTLECCVCYAVNRLKSAETEESVENILCAVLTEMFEDLRDDTGISGLFMPSGMLDMLMQAQKDNENKTPDVPAS